jgi:predicted metal-dependent HD superfamily phosphohydrolase
MEMLSANNIHPEKINDICGIIMATKIPQSPKTKLEKIICDADLDYLGRTDYFAISGNLRREFLAFQKIKNDKEWIELQQNFLQSHTYFTKTSVALRQSGVDENLRKVSEIA